MLTCRSLHFWFPEQKLLENNNKINKWTPLTFCCMQGELPTGDLHPRKYILWMCFVSQNRNWSVGSDRTKEVVEMRVTLLWGAKRTLWKMRILKDIWTLKDFVMGKLFSGTFFPFSRNLKSADFLASYQHDKNTVHSHSKYTLVYLPMLNLCFSSFGSS